MVTPDVAGLEVSADEYGLQMTSTVPEARAASRARYRDTRAGFDIYRRSGGEITLPDLNSRLSDAGYEPIGARSFRHFGALLAAGYRRYVPINRFEIVNATEPYENAWAMARYAYTETDLGVEVVFAKASVLHEAAGRAAEAGETGAILRFREPAVIDGLRKLRPRVGSMVTVRYLEAGRSITGRIVEIDLDSEPIVVEIEYARLVSIATIGVTDAYPTERFSFVLTERGEHVQTLELINRRLFLFFELLEGVRALVNEANGNERYAAPPELFSLSVASPAEIVIDVAEIARAVMPLGLIGTLLAASAAFTARRKEYHEGTGQKLDNRLKEIALQEAELRLQQQRSEAALREEIVRRVRELFHEVPNTELNDRRLARLIEDGVLRPLRELGELGIDGIDPPAEAN